MRFATTSFQLRDDVPDNTILIVFGAYTTMIAHRFDETGDTFVADFTVATNAAELKAGAPARSERVEKYNQL